MRAFRVLWALDDWGHRHLPRWLHRVVFGPICGWLDNELTKPVSTFHKDRA